MKYKKVGDNKYKKVRDGFDYLWISLVVISGLALVASVVCVIICKVAGVL